MDVAKRLNQQPLAKGENMLIAYKFIHILQSKSDKSLAFSKLPSRWSNKGYPIIYASTSLFSAKMELMKNIGVDDKLISKQFRIFRILIPDKYILKINKQDFPNTWNLLNNVESTQNIGNYWFEKGKSLALLIPSTVFPTGYNVLINSKHKAFKYIKFRKIQNLQPSQSVDIKENSNNIIIENNSKEYPIRMQVITKKSEKKVFISHASEDRIKYVDELVKELQSMGIDVWYSKNEIHSNIVDEIEGGIAKCRAMVCVITPNYIGSKWAMAEFKAGVYINIERNPFMVQLFIGNNEFIKKFREDHILNSQAIYIKWDSNAHNSAKSVAQWIDNNII
jgi:RES domain-containing protein